MKCFLLTVAAVIAMPRWVIAHVQMSNPFPIRSALDPSNPEALKDYNMAAPLLTDGSDYPCKTYNNDRPVRVVTTYEAGSVYNMSVVGSATHGGGSCQLSLSYDNGQTFKVIQSMMGGCPLQLDYEFTMPGFAPSGIAIFAWTWFNLIGNREMYMNCAVVAIQRTTGEQTDMEALKFANLPDIYLANIRSKSNTITIEGQEVVFPDPGAQVIFGGSVSGTSPPAPGLYSAYMDTTGPGSLTAPETKSESSLNSPATYSMLANSSRTSKATTRAKQTTNSLVYPNTRSPVRQSTSPSLRIPSSYSQSLSSSLDHNQSGAPVSRSSPLSMSAMSSHTSLSVGLYYHTSTTSFTEQAYSSNVPSASLAHSSLASPSYDNLTSDIIGCSIPCEAAKICCAGTNIFYMCNGLGSGSVMMGSPPSGTECLDGAIVKARTMGDCQVLNSMKCGADGKTFAICDHGGWVPMGAVAAGTICQNGHIVAA